MLKKLFSKVLQPKAGRRGFALLKIHFNCLIKKTAVHILALL